MILRIRNRIRDLISSNNLIEAHDKEAVFSGVPESLRAELADVFDEIYYIKTNPDVAKSNIDPLSHYLEVGWKEGRDPSPDFSTTYYLTEHRDIAKGGANPLIHYVRHGHKERRQCRPLRVHISAQDICATKAELCSCLKVSDQDASAIIDGFDESYYLQLYHDVSGSRAHPLLHYLQYGWREKRDPSADFSTEYYLTENQDVGNGWINPFVHYILHGRSEGRRGVPPNSLQAPTNINEYSEIDYRTIADRFDIDYYTRKYPEVAESGADPIAHYLTIGCKKGYNPAPYFSTSYYLARNKDIAESGINPFAHYVSNGERESREALSYIDRDIAAGFNPLVSVIVPNYNHAEYLRQRIDSIIGQTYTNIELIILDDASTDDSQQVIREITSSLSIKATLHFNAKNTGKVFRQWEKGLSLASGDLVWICESDDFCAPDFLEKIVRHFADQSVNIAFGRIQFCDSAGAPLEGLDQYRNNAESGIWKESITRPAANWFRNGFGVNNLIANVGGCVFRNIRLPKRVWEEAATYKICGDWFLYCHIAGAGQIAYEPKSVAWFRQHVRNTSATNFHKEYYYDELIKIAYFLTSQWDIPSRTIEKFLRGVSTQYRHFNMEEAIGAFDKVYALGDLYAQRRSRTHIQIAFHGFTLGGGEIFPIHLANELYSKGYQVSILANDMLSGRSDIRKLLKVGIPVYSGFDFLKRNRAEYFDALGIDVMHTHVLGSDVLLAEASDDPLERPCVATMHGSHVDMAHLSAKLASRIVSNVSSWCYLADKNLDELGELRYIARGLRKVDNALPSPDKTSVLSRDNFGIGDREIVFTLAARCVKRKGWRAAIAAYRHVTQKLGRSDIRLILVGDGDLLQEMQKSATDLPGVKFLGYRSDVREVLRISDVHLLPSRFEGESYPLIAIEALQEGLPLIATDIGEIRHMMSSSKEHVAGILLRNQRSTEVFTLELAEAMEKMLDPEFRLRARSLVASAASKFDMAKVVSDYEEVYRLCQSSQPT